MPVPARCHFIKYAAINKLISLLENRSLGYGELLSKIGGKPQRLEKLVNDLTTFNELFSFLRGDVRASNDVAMKPDIAGYLQRVFSAVMKVGRHIFDTPEDKHPLVYEESSNGDINKEKNGLLQLIWNT